MDAVGFWIWKWIIWVKVFYGVVYRFGCGYHVRYHG